MSYTWEELMFGIDVRNENTRKAQQQQEAERKRAEESSMQSAWSLGLSLLGGALFGPGGYYIGKQIGTYGADEGWFEGWFGGPDDYSDWEESYMEEGKFNVEAAKRFNETLDQAAKDQDSGQLLNSVIDLGKMWLQAGGLTAAPGELDLWTWGSGEDAWTVFSEESKIPGLGWDMPGKQLSVEQSLWDPNRSLFENIGKTISRGASIYKKDLSISTIENMAKEVYEEQKKVKKAE